MKKSKPLILKLQFLKSRCANLCQHNLRIYSGGIILVTLAICIISTSTYARPELGPPSIKLRTNVSNIAVAELDAISSDFKLTFKVDQNLHNEAEEFVLVRSDALTSDRLAIGQSYVIAYVAWEVKRFPRAIKKRADGAVIISLQGASPAVFQPNPELIELLKWDVTDSLQNPVSMLPVILRGIASTDPQLQSFFVTELVTRPSLHSQMTSEQKRIVAGYLSSSSYAADARDLILSDQAFSKLILRQSGRLAIARQVVLHHPVYIESGSEYSGLIRTAMEVLEQSQDSSDALAAQRWLTSNQPALIESAAAIIYAVNPDTLLTALEHASQQSLLKKQSRETLAALVSRYRHSLAEN